MRLITSSVLLAAVLALSPAVAAPTTDLPVPADATVSGVVARVVGGRVVLRLDGGRTASYSVTPGSVAEGQRISAGVRRVGDALRLEHIQVQR